MLSFFRNNYRNLDLYPVLNRTAHPTTEAEKMALKVITELRNLIIDNARIQGGKFFKYQPEGVCDGVPYTLSNPIPPGVVYFSINCTVTPLGRSAYKVIHPNLMRFLRTHYRANFHRLQSQHGISASELTASSPEEVMVALGIYQCNPLKPFSTGYRNVIRRYRHYIKTQDAKARDFPTHHQFVYPYVRINLSFAAWRENSEGKEEIFTASLSHQVNLKNCLFSFLNNLSIEFLQTIANEGVPPKLRRRIVRLTTDLRNYCLSSQSTGKEISKTEDYPDHEDGGKKSNIAIFANKRSTVDSIDQSTPSQPQVRPVVRTIIINLINGLIRTPISLPEFFSSSTAPN